jgi:hypothetical protein
MIRESGGKFYVIKHDGTKILGTHSTREKAERQLRAIETHKRKKEKR